MEWIKIIPKNCIFHPNNPTFILRIGFVPDRLSTYINVRIFIETNQFGFLEGHNHLSTSWHAKINVTLDEPILKCSLFMPPHYLQGCTKNSFIMEGVACKTTNSHSIAVPSLKIPRMYAHKSNQPKPLCPPFISQWRYGTINLIKAKAPNYVNDLNSNTFFSLKVDNKYFDVVTGCITLRTKNATHWLEETTCQWSTLSIGNAWAEGDLLSFMWSLCHCAQNIDTKPNDILDHLSRLGKGP